MVFMEDGSHAEAAGQEVEHEVARMAAPLIFAFNNDTRLGEQVRSRRGRASSINRIEANIELENANYIASTSTTPVPLSVTSSNPRCNIARLAVNGRHQECYERITKAPHASPLRKSCACCTAWCCIMCIPSLEM